MSKPLGRLYPKHFDHVEKYALSDTLAASTAIQPVYAGICAVSRLWSPQ